MPILPRDPDGYIDLDAVSDDEVDLDLAGLAPVPALPNQAWEEIVGAAPYTDPAALGIDVDDVLAPPMEVAAAAAFAPDDGDSDLPGSDATDLGNDDPVDFDFDDPSFSDE